MDFIFNAPEKKQIALVKSLRWFRYFLFSVSIVSLYVSIRTGQELHQFTLDEPYITNEYWELRRRQNWLVFTTMLPGIFGLVVGGFTYILREGMENRIFPRSRLERFVRKVMA